MFDERGWSNVAALQLRNPMHRSHEYLAKIAVEVCDGVLIHSLIGNLKPGDIPAETRVQAIDILIDNYFVKENVINAGYPLDMRYAGPREGLLHATFRQNYGVNNMLIGRDHAGVGDFYGLFEAQEIFDRIPTTGDDAKDLLCKPMKIDWTFYCSECDGMASLRTCPHDKESRVILSGTKLRKALSDGAEIVDHFGRDEVLDHLKVYYGNLKEKVEVKMQGAASGDDAKDLLCKPMKMDWTFYCSECDGMASLRTCPHDKESRVILSGTKLRKALSDGAEIVDHFGRDEVLDHLKIYYGNLKEKVEVKMQGAASGDSM